MRQDIKEKWVAALRSGEYKQGFGRLRRGDTFCCLGVLCDLAVKEGPGGQWSEKNAFVTENNELSIGSLPWDVVTWADLPTPDPVIPATVSFGTVFRPLTNLNDGLTLNFNQIADAIQAAL